MSPQDFVINDPAHQDFQVNRRAMVDPRVLEAEMRRIFDTCWIYVGHESEVRTAGDFKTRNVCGRPIIFCRDSKAEIRIYLNVCRHRGAIVCREPEGNAKGFFAFITAGGITATANLTAFPARPVTRPALIAANLDSPNPRLSTATKGSWFCPSIP